MAYRYPRGWGQQMPPAGATVDWGDPINNGAFAVYLLNEGGGQRLTNLVNPKGNVTAFGANNAWSTGNGGSAVICNSTGSAINIGNSSGSGWGAGNVMSYSAWVYFTTFLTGNQSIIGGQGFNTQWRIDYSTAVQTLNEQGIVFIGSSTTALTTNKWFFVCMTYNASGTVQFYLNGKADGSATSLQTFNRSAQAELCGATGDGAPMTSGAKLSGFRGWDRVLTPTEVLRLFQEPFAGIYKPRQYWSRAGAAAGGAIISPMPFYNTIYINE